MRHRLSQVGIHDRQRPLRMPLRHSQPSGLVVILQLLGKRLTIDGCELRNRLRATLL